MKKSQLIASLLLPAASIVVIASVGTAIAVDMSTSSKIKIATSDGKTSAQLGDGDSVIIKTDTTKLNGDVTWDFFDSDGTKLDTAPYIEVGTKNNSQIELTYHVANNTANSTNYTVQASINDTVSNSFKIDMMNLVSLN
ncbi:hypothetical protein FACS1894166_08240 [Bacilli bacterium]|nr:hypothetical protein FACS1894166_08240 [Bacilli bacterium]